MNDAYTPARLYATVFGAVLVVAGIIGFFYNSTFTSDESVHDDVLGILSVNGWHNMVHLATGLLGLAMMRSAARQYALGLGIVYVVVAIWGFAIGSGDSILSIVPVNTADNVLHLLTALVGLVIALGPVRSAVADRAPAV